MHPTYLSKKLLMALTLSVIFYVLFRVKSHQYRVSFVLKNVPPNKVWEHVADFSNMKQLNPTIVDFDVISESGNYDHWKYSVEYSEYLSHWPRLPNYATAHFNLREESGIYHVTSTHITCFLPGFFCLNSKSDFKFSKIHQSSTLCEEMIEYECPNLFKNFCSREIAYQRQAIMDNLKLEFDSN